MGSTLHHPHCLPQPICSLSRRTDFSRNSCDSKDASLPSLPHPTRLANDSLLFLQGAAAPAVPAAAWPSTKWGTVSEAVGSWAGLCAEAGLGSLGKPFPPARAHAAASQFACKQEHQISSKAVILATHLLAGRGFCDAGSAGCSVSGWQEDVSRRKEKLEVFLLTPRCLKSSSQLQTQHWQTFCRQSSLNIQPQLLINFLVTAPRRIPWAGLA